MSRRKKMLTAKGRRENHVVDPTWKVTKSKIKPHDVQVTYACICPKEDCKAEHK